MFVKTTRGPKTRKHSIKEKKYQNKIRSFLFNYYRTIDFFFSNQYENKYLFIFFCINDSFNVYSVFVLSKNDGSSFVFNTDTQDKATAPHRPCSLYIVLINGLADQHKNPYKPSIYLFETLPVMLT